MTKHGKIYQDSIKMEDPEQVYSLAEAMDIIKSFPPRKFDQTVDGVFRLGVDPRKADQMVRGTVNLPHGTGKTARVLVLPTVKKQMRPGLPVLTSSAPMNSSPKLLEAGQISTPRLPPQI